MEKRANLGLSALKIIGYIYAGMGGVFVILGLSLWNVLTEDNLPLIGIIFSGIGSIFLILGIIFLVIENKKQKMADRLLAEGRYIMGEVADLTWNHNVTINGRHPTVVLVRCVDSHGQIHIYRSRNINSYVDPCVIGKPVRVYTQAIGSKEYYVDLDGVLPQVIEH